MTATTLTDDTTATSAGRARSGDRPPDPPGPRGLPVLGVAHEFARDPWGYLPKLARKYGDVVNVPNPFATVISVSHPDYVRQVLSNITGYDRSPEIIRVGLTQPGARSLPLRDGEDWRRVRRTLNPKFSNKSLKTIGDLIADSVSNDVRGWERHVATGEWFELQDELASMTMAALQRAMFSAELPREELLSRANKAKRHGHFFPRAGATFAAMSRLPYGRELYERLPWPHLAKGRANLAAMVDDVEAMVVQRRADPTDADDLLNVMLGARFEDGSGFTDEDLRWELLTLLFAGFETTAAALAWTLQLLIRNPEALARMRTEVDALPAGPIGAEHVDHLEYVRACFDEGQRIQANIANFRFATRDDVIGGYHVPAGATVVMPMYGLHFDPRFWKRPEEFRPERFLEDEINPHAFIPFGAGPRKCIGVRLAYLEGLLALAEIVRSYELELQPGWSPERDYRLGVWLKSVPVRLTRR